MSFILSVLFYLCLSAIVAAPHQALESLLLGRDAFTRKARGSFRVMFEEKRRGTNGGGNECGDGDGIVAFRRRLLILTTLVITTSTIEGYGLELEKGFKHEDVLSPLVYIEREHNNNNKQKS